MRLIVFLLFTILPFSLAAQTESTLSIGSGLFFFGGSSAVKNSFLIMDQENKTSYINNPYGKKPGFSFNLSQDIHYCTKRGFLVGNSLGFNYLRSITKLEQIAYIREKKEEIESKAVLKMYDLSVTPFLGKRYKIKNIDIDVCGGLEVAFPIYAEDRATITTSVGYEIETDRKRNMIKTDIRPTLKVNTYYRNYGLFAAYSHGLSNYTAKMNGANMEVYSRLFRFGINYRLSKS